jgi:hypothetical protein
VRSRNVRILKVESLVLKKKRECESDKGEENTHKRFYIEGCHHSWRGALSSIGASPIYVSRQWPYSTPRAPQKADILAWVQI